MAKLVQWLVLDFGSAHYLRVVGLSPNSGYTLSVEGGQGGLCLRFSFPLPVPPHLHINKSFKKKYNYNIFRVHT